MADEEDQLDFNEDIADIDEELVEEELKADENSGQQRELAKEKRALEFLNLHHPECKLDYREEILQKLQVSAYPPDNGIDKKHKSVPYLTIFEKTKILGFRANQLAQGCKPFINPVPPHLTDVLEIAALELEQRRLPYILKRPMPDGSFEYVRLSDLLIV
jgi:DNA-directed RNA polymerase subunit K/omega